MKWFGHPGDSPHDIRARKFVVRWAHEIDPASDLRQHAVRNKLPVWRWTYLCAGVHDRDIEDSKDDSEKVVEEGSDLNDASNRDEDEDVNGEIESSGRNRWQRCSGGVTLQAGSLSSSSKLPNLWNLIV